MEIRKTKPEELKEVKKIYKHARGFMVEEGNLTQWKNLEQLYENVLQDIKNGNSYVFVEYGKIAAVFCFFVGSDPTYDKIYNGEWLNNETYGVIHRIVVNVHQKGIATKCIQWCLQQFSNIKIDTHKDNIPMQKTILKNNFEYCGIIKKEDGSERLAYQYKSK